MAKNKKKEIRGLYGEGSVYKMKDGRYGAAASLPKGEDGKRNRKIFTGKSEEEVFKKMCLFLEEGGFIDKVETTIDSKPQINSETLVEDFVKEFKLVGLWGKSEISTRTYENYEYSLNHFEKYFKGKSIGIIDTQSINGFFRCMEKIYKGEGDYKYSQVTLKRIEYIVERMFDRGCENEYITINPFKKRDYSKPKSKKFKKKYLDLLKRKFN